MRMFCFVFWNSSSVINPCSSNNLTFLILVAGEACEDEELPAAEQGGVLLLFMEAFMVVMKTSAITLKASADPSLLTLLPVVAGLFPAPGRCSLLFCTHHMPN